MDISKQLRDFQEKAKKCTVCRGMGLLHQNGDGRWAYPVLQQTPSDYRGIVAVMEAANRDDTYSARKGYITCDPSTDPTGRFLFQLLTSVGLSPNNIILTNAALCFPVTEKNPKTQQVQNCSRWLAELIDYVKPLVVVTFGKAALEAVGKIERHNLPYQQALGRPVAWRGRKLLALAHPSALGRRNIPAERQLQDIRVLRTLL